MAFLIHSLMPGRYGCGAAPIAGIVVARGWPGSDKSFLTVEACTVVRILYLLPVVPGTLPLTEPACGRASSLFDPTSTGIAEPSRTWASGAEAVGDFAEGMAGRAPTGWLAMTRFSSASSREDNVLRLLISNSRARTRSVSLCHAAFRLRRRKRSHSSRRKTRTAGKIKSSGMVSYPLSRLKVLSSSVFTASLTRVRREPRGDLFDSSQVELA